MHTDTRAPARRTHKNRTCLRACIRLAALLLCALWAVALHAQSTTKETEPADLVPDTGTVSPNAYDDGGDGTGEAIDSSYTFTATGKSAPPLTLIVDTSGAVTPRQPDPAKLRAYRTDPGFNYSDTLEEDASKSPPYSAKTPRISSPSLSSGTALSAPSLGGAVWLYLIAAVGVGALAYFLITKFGKGGRRNPEAQKEAVAEQKTEENTDDIRELDFEALLAQATAGGDLRRAVRLLYLQALRQLTDRHIIDWKPHTSNHEYAWQIPAALRPPFGRITNVFEYAWYGQMAINQGAFTGIRQMFRDFENTVKNAA